MSNPENTKLCDFTSTNNNDFICTPIAPPAPKAIFYEIKPALLNHVMKEQFSGASISVMPRKFHDMIDLPPLENCYLDVHLADIAKKKPLERINDVLIMVNNNLVPVDFFVLDVECNASCPIVLGRPFLRTVGSIIDMKEGSIRYQFPLKKGTGHFPRKRKKLPFDSIIRRNYDIDASSLENT
jgi:hypothetical protein